MFHTVSYAMTCGLSVTAAVSIYSVEGASGLFGRVVFGLLGDRFGAKRVFAVGLLVQALAAGSYMFARQRPEFYIVAAVFGFVYAGVMPLYAVLMRENFPLPIMGTMVGAGSMASSLGMALGPLAGGLIFDSSGSYAWLYISSSVSASAHPRSCSASDPHASLHSPQPADGTSNRPSAPASRRILSLECSSQRMSTPYVLTKHRPRGAALWEFEQTFQCEIEAAAVMRSNAGAGFAAKVSDDVVEVSVCVGRDDQTRHVERRSSILAFRRRKNSSPRSHHRVRSRREPFRRTAWPRRDRPRSVL